MGTSRVHALARKPTWDLIAIYESLVADGCGYGTGVDAIPGMSRDQLIAAILNLQDLDQGQGQR